MTRVFLHAGTQKTGTTAIQGFARDNRAALLERGLLFPDPSPFAPDSAQPHHALAHAVAGAPGPLARADVAPMIADWAETASRHNADLLISAEPIWRHVIRHKKDKPGDWRSARTRYLRRLARHLAPLGEVVPVVVFRRPEDYLVSAFRENVARATTPPPWSDFAGFRDVSLKKRLRYTAGARGLARCFGSLLALDFADLTAQGTVTHAFFRALGMDTTDLPDPGVVRAGLGTPETAVKLALLRKGYAKEKNRAVLDWLRTPEVTAEITRIFGPGPYGFWENPQALTDFRARMAPDVERLRVAFFEECDVLFPALDAPPLPPVPDPGEALEALLARAPV